MNYNIAIYIIFITLTYIAQFFIASSIMTSSGSHCQNNALIVGTRTMMVLATIGAAGFGTYYVCRSCQDDSGDYAPRIVYIITIILSLASMITSANVLSALNSDNSCISAANLYTYKMMVGWGCVAMQILVLFFGIYWLNQSRSKSYQIYLAAQNARDAKLQANREVANKAALQQAQKYEADAAVNERRKDEAKKAADLLRAGLVKQQDAREAAEKAQDDLQQARRDAERKPATIVKPRSVNRPVLQTGVARPRSPPVTIKLPNRQREDSTPAVQDKPARAKDVVVPKEAAVLTRTPGDSKLQGVLPKTPPRTTVVPRSRQRTVSGRTVTSLPVILEERKRPESAVPPVQPSKIIRTPPSDLQEEPPSKRQRVGGTVLRTISNKRQRPISNADSIRVPTPGPPGTIQAVNLRLKPRPRT